MKTMAAARFKATCLAVMDEVQARREPILLTKNGKPVAKLVPIDEEKDPLAAFRFPGHITIVGDIISPIHSDEELEKFSEQSIKVFDPDAS